MRTAAKLSAEIVFASQAAAAQYTSTIGTNISQPKMEA